MFTKIAIICIFLFLNSTSCMSGKCNDKDTCISYLQKKIIFLNKHYEGYNSEIEELSITQVARYMNHTYLDYTGSGLYQESQLEGFFEDLKLHRYGNAHSKNPSAQSTDKKLTESRIALLKFFNTDLSRYTVIYTSGATAALKTVGENFLWSENSLYYYLRINHNSVIGIREYAAESKAQFKALSENEVSKLLYERKRDNKKNDQSALTKCLFAYPAKDNFAGVVYPLEWIHEVKQYGLSDNCKWYVLIDIAAYVPTHAFDLSLYNMVDFTVVSFYKIFGYPTGLGALILKNESSSSLNKVYFGGGSVITLSCDTRSCKRQGSDHFAYYEDGTLPFLDVNALLVSLNIFTQIPMNTITKHVRVLTEYTFEELSKMKHSNWSKVVEVYHAYDKPSDGIISFNCLDKFGYHIPFFVVETKAAFHNIHVRTGCFCNAGGCQDYLNLTNEEILDSYENRESCSDEGVPNKKPYGAVRVSFGYLSTFEDAFRFLKFIQDNFVN